MKISLEWYPEMGGEVHRNDNEPHLQLPVTAGNYPTKSFPTF